MVKTCNGGLAHLARAPALQAGGNRFDSDILHNKQFTVYRLQFGVKKLEVVYCSLKLVQ